MPSVRERTQRDADRRMDWGKGQLWIVEIVILLGSMPRDVGLVEAHSKEEGAGVTVLPIPRHLVKHIDRMSGKFALRHIIVIGVPLLASAVRVFVTNAIAWRSAHKLV